MQCNAYSIEVLVFWKTFYFFRSWTLVENHRLRQTGPGGIPLRQVSKWFTKVEVYSNWSVCPCSGLSKVCFKIWCETVDGWNPANQLRLVVFPILCTVLYIPGGTGFQPSTESLWSTTALNICLFFLPPTWTYGNKTRNNFPFWIHYLLE